ncbi:DNA replication protein [Clostridium perfringens]
MHGEYGDKGLWRTRNLSSKYESCRLKNLPKLSPDVTNVIVHKYIEDVGIKVQEGKGLFLCAKAIPGNTYGTGIGKTTTAATIINEYTIQRGYEHLKGDRKLTHRANPAIFLKISDFQNLFNSQFRGPIEVKERASCNYYKMKIAAMSVELLVLDDIAVRTGTEAFINEMYEILDHRATEDLATIFTSNVTLDKLEPLYGERIVSRIKGMTVTVYYADKDHRVKS